MHAYAAVSTLGASDLYFATGTTGFKGGYTKESPRKKKKKGRGGAAVTPAVTRAVSAIVTAAADEAAADNAAEASGVGATEYRDILAGKGAHAQQAGMLNEMRDIFAAAGRNLIWQQDGAGAHTINQHSAKGKATRDLILSIAHDLLEDWPSLSADLTPIENFWWMTEHRLWSTGTWHDLKSFKEALRKAWREVTGDLAVLRRVVGSFEKRRKACIEAQGGKIKY